MPFFGQICSRGAWDESVPNIKFNSDGVSNYALLYDNLCEAYPRGEQGKTIWKTMVQKIKDQGKGKRYDCVIGVSGGTDSSYLMHIAKEEGLRPLAVNLDNGWNSNIALKNIEKITSSLGIDLETYVINYEEIKDLLKCYMYAGMPWIDMPSDLAIKAVLYKIAANEGIKYILRGNDFHSEGSQPTEWTYGDGKQLKFIHNKYGKIKLKTFPNYTSSALIYYGIIKRIKSIYPFYYIDYNKNIAQKFLAQKYNWEYYGGHHHENLFSKFAISYWLPFKFNIDKRKITYSAQILSGAISREEALTALKISSNTDKEYEQLLSYVLKKLDMTEDEFKTIMDSPNRSYMDYPSYYPLFHSFKKIITIFSGLLFVHKPMIFFKIDMKIKDI
jgi:N-acetyl sugar amidotransferase